MVGYFKKYNIALILLGAAAGFLAAYFGGKGIFSMIAYPIIGGAAGRFLCGLYANKQVGKWNDILFRNGEPRKFIAVFGPVAEATSPNTLERSDSYNKLAYAYGALGDFDKAWELLTSLTPKSEKDGLVTTASNKVRLLLLREKISEAEAMLNELRDAVAVVSAKNQKLGYSGKHYIRLYEIWLNILKEEDADLEFIEEEIRLSDNPVRNSELKLLLAKAWEDRGEDELSEELRLEAMSVGMGLWAENKARQQLTKE
jgi:pentatricopeptide repeat protein